MKCLYCFVLELSYSQTWVSMLPAGWQQYPISLLGLRGLKKKGFQSGDCSDSSAVGMKRVSHISAYDFRWLESTGMSNITLKSTCCEQTEWQFHPLRLIYGSSDFFFYFFLPLLLHSLCPSHQRHSHNSTTGLFSAMWLQLCLSLNLRYQTTCLLGWKNVICSQMTWNDTPISRL